ncbi:MAG TPA: hypothetical protein VFV71_04075 [Burkholderiales bacterium]|nr:hypothetical protein [Burkholderiales bacterium]
MLRKVTLASVVGATIAATGPAAGADDAQVQQIHEEIKALKDGYEARIRQLEERLDQAQRPGADAGAAPAPAAPAAAANAFNPAISLILGGQYNNLQRDPDTYQIGGFIPGGDEIGPGSRSFNLGESELDISANVDPYFSGLFALALNSDNEAEVEEAYVQNTGSISGLTVKFGRMLSGFGYLNEFHAHAWDFADAPLIHQAFFGGQLREDGLQARWLAPTPVFLELGAEAGRGAAFPGSDRDKNGLNSAMLFVHVGDDIGDSHSYRVGASYRVTEAQDRSYEDLDAAGSPVTDAFTGDSRMWGLDFVWKWAPGGNPVDRNFKLQGEYMHRVEDGSLAFDTGGANLSGPYRSSQSGWYLQGVYQFVARWRAGLRFEELYSGDTAIGLADNGTLPAADFPALAQNNPRRATLMVDFSPSEFSRLRLQFARDEARFNEADNQVFLQYIMSLGSHGAHKF